LKLKTLRKATIAIITLTGVAGCGAGSSAELSHQQATAVVGASGSPLAAQSQSAASPPPRGVNCNYTADQSQPTGSKTPSLPAARVGNTGPVYATITTDHGSIVMKLDAKSAPCTVNSFVSLARQGFYDNTFCHRLLDQAEQGLTYGVLQCGDPTGAGGGGPGYTFPDENLARATYGKGMVAMANSGPNTNGSQFFMMFKNSSFDPSYTPFAKILSGLDVLNRIAKDGSTLNPATGQNDAPKTRLTITKVSISDTLPTT
jgi:peptidyl-prolyl cis-trans isomerase B (cyclophilin B)